MSLRFLSRILLLALAASACSPLSSSEPSAAPGAAKPAPLASEALGKLPLAFFENRGQVPNPEILHYAGSSGGAIGFTPGGLLFSLSDRSGTSQRWGLAMDFVGAQAFPRAEKRLEGVASFFTGDREDWLTGIPTYGRIVYRDLWPGIDLVYRPDGQAMKYELLVRPGADPSDIRLRWRGANAVSVEDDGSLRVTTPAGTLTDGAPVSFQGGRRVPTSYVLEGTSVGFRTGRYDSSRLLVIDPVVSVYAGFIGGNDEDYPEAIAVDASGAVYIAGATYSSQATFPETVGPDLSFNASASLDAFVAKVNPQGTALVYAGYIGGDLDDGASGIAVDGAGAAYVAGFTDSFEPSFPVMVGPRLTKNGQTDGFVAKVNPQGTGLEYAGYVGGDIEDELNAAAVDGAGALYVVGSTTSPTLPGANAPDPTYNDGVNQDAFVAKVQPGGAALVYSGYIGSDYIDSGRGIAVDGSASAYVTGTIGAGGMGFPDGDGFGPIPGPDQTNGGFQEGFVVKLNPNGSFAYAGYIGGANTDSAGAIAVDPSGAAYVTGGTDSPPPSFPAEGGPSLTYSGSSDAYVAKVNPAGTDFVYAGYIGGALGDSGQGIAVDPTGAAVVAGGTGSTEATFPEAVGPDLSHNGDTDAFVAKVTPAGTALSYAGYIGGAGYDVGNGVAIDQIGGVYITGETQSDAATFPEAVGPDLTTNGMTDGFVAKISDNLCLGAGVTIQGTSGNDTITGTADPDVILALGGNDTIDAAGGNDVICAGDGDDTVIGGAGDDTLDGEAGTDTASFPAGPVNADLALGTATGQGTDTLANTENLTGSPVGDTLGGNAAANVIRAGAGDDRLLGTGGNDLLLGGDGDDTAFGGDGDDELQGEAGKDRLVGEGGNDLAVGGTKADRLSGGGGKDRLRGQGGKDRLSGGGANDRLAGGKGNDRMNGGKGKKDRCNGGKGKADTATKCEKITGVP